MYCPESNVSNKYRQETLKAQNTIRQLENLRHLKFPIVNYKSLCLEEGDMQMPESHKELKH